MSIYLREITRTDIPTINQWRNDHELVGFLAAPFRYIAQEVDEKWFESYLLTRSNNVRLAICEVSSGKMLGVVYLLQIDWLNRSCEYAIQIGDGPSQGHGVGFDATVKILEHAFVDLNLHRVYLTVLEGNDRALKLYKKIGFCEEGVHREAVFKKGQYCNLIQMAILQKSFSATVR